MRLNQKHLIVFSLTFSALVTLSGIGLTAYISTWKVTDKTQTIKTNEQCWKNSKGKFLSNVYIFTYEIEGKSYHLRQCGASPNVTTISYNPNIPERAILITPFILQVIGVLFASLGIVATIGILFAIRSH